MIRKLLPALLILSLAVGCSGGGGGGGGGPLPATPTPGGTPTPVPVASVTVLIDQPGGSATAPRPAYVSRSTQSVVVSVVPTAGGTPVLTTTNCTTGCATLVSAPVGQDTFVVSLYNQRDGDGSVLSRGTKTVTINPGADTVSLVLDGVVAMIGFTIDVQPVVHTPGTAHITVSAEDANANPITGPGAYPTIALANDDASGTVTLNATSVSTPNAVVTATYNGAWIATGNASANITATISGSPITSTFAISPQPVSASYPGLTNPQSASMVTGSDGALWFTGAYNTVGRITTAGALTQYNLPNTRLPFAIAAGSDGALWMADGDAGGTDVGRLTTGGAASTCTAASSVQATNITEGSDGNVWVATTAGLARVTPACVVTQFPVPGANFQGMTNGPDGALWFTQNDSSTVSEIGRMTTAGTLTQYPMPTSPAWPVGITTGPDGNLWFTDGWSSTIGRISTAGAITEFPRKNSDPIPLGRMTVGPDGAIWFAAQGGIGRISLSGKMTAYPLGGSVYSLILGPDNALWGIALFNNGNVVRLSI